MRESSSCYEEYVVSARELAAETFMDIKNELVGRDERRGEDRAEETASLCEFDHNVIVPVGITTQSCFILARKSLNQTWILL